MNVRLYDGTVRCGEHMDASSHQGMTDDACLYCPVEALPVPVDLTKDIPHSPELAEAVKFVRRIRKPSLPRHPLYDHREGLRINDLTVLASAFWLDANARGALAPIPGTIVNGRVVPVNF